MIGGCLLFTDFGRLGSDHLRKADALSLAAALTRMYVLLLLLPCLALATEFYRTVQSRQQGWAGVMFLSTRYIYVRTSMYDTYQVHS